MMLTRAQLRVLTALLDGPKQTSKTTNHGVVSGSSARSLIDRRLARAVWLQSVFHVEITEAGRTALARNGSD